MAQPHLTLIRSVAREFICQSRVGIEVTLAADTPVTFGDLSFTLPAGTDVDAYCEAPISTNDERVEIHAGEARWECPRCGYVNHIDLSSDDLG